MIHLSLIQELLRAAVNGDTVEVSRLIGMGADVETTDENGNTPLILATAKGHVSIIRWESKTKTPHWNAV